MAKKISVAISQINTETGNLEENSNKVVSSIHRAINEGSDILLLPELAITGYCCGALFNQVHFVEYNKKFLTDVIVPEVPSNLVVVIGFVDVRGVDKVGFPILYNSVAIIQDRKIIGIYDKILLANGNHHEDRKYFNPGKEVKVFEVDVRGEKIIIGTPICEDCWDTDNDRDIAQEMVFAGAEILLCANQSYFYWGKEKRRIELFKKQGFSKKVPFLTSNSSGIGDITKDLIVFDGGSMIVDKHGDLIKQAKQFDEDFITAEVELWDDETDIQGKYISSETSYNDKEKYEEILNALIFLQRTYFKLMGDDFKAQIHVSGGIDSALVLAISVIALGSEKVIAISNPTRDNHSVTRANAKQICEALGVHLYWNSMEEPYNAFVESFEKAFGQEPNLSERACMQAVGRTVAGLSATHHFKSLILGTGNHSEIVCGWSSFHDVSSVGAYQPIGDLTKVEVIFMSKFLNEKYGREIIPYELFNMPALAELADTVDRENPADPFDYYIISGVCAELIRERKDILDLIDEFKNKKLNPEYFPLYPNGKSIYENVSEELFIENVHMCFSKAKQSVYKCAQSAPIVILAGRGRGFSNRETLINKYTGFYDIKSPEHLETVKS